MIKSAAYLDGQTQALAFYKVALKRPAGTGGLLSQALPWLAALGIPLAAAGIAGARAPEGEGGRDAFLTGSGSFLGGPTGGLAGVLGGASLGARLGGPGPGRAQTMVGGALLGGAMGLGAGQIGGAALGHLLHDQTADRPPPAPGDVQGSARPE